jgi:hypothetical protein
MSNQQSTTSHSVVMSSKYNGLVSTILNWNKSSKIITDESFMIVIRAKVVMIDGESTFKLLESPNGELIINYKTTSSDGAFKNLHIDASYPQSVCVSNYDLVWHAFKEKIENAMLDNTKRAAQDLVDRFYGK